MEAWWIHRARAFVLARSERVRGWHARRCERVYDVLSCKGLCGVFGLLSCELRAVALQCEY